jgi:hypothetical protein
MQKRPSENTRRVLYPLVDRFWLPVILSTVAVVIVMMVIPVTIVVIFMVPVAFMKLPSLLIVIVVRMTPICALVRRLLPAASNPSVMVALWGPIALDPDVAGTGCIASLFVTNRRRSAADVYRNLRERWDGDCCQ